MAPPKAKALPLVLDFDGTLQRDDLSQIGLCWLFKVAPLRALGVLMRGLFQGRAAAKLTLEEAAFQHNFMPTLHWNQALITAAKASGQPILVATGSPERWVAALLAEADLPWPVLGTTAISGNFIGTIKAHTLVARFGKGGFDYAGNSRSDLAVWAVCREAWVVSRRGRLVKKASKRAAIKKVFPA